MVFGIDRPWHVSLVNGIVRHKGKSCILSFADVEVFQVFGNELGYRFGGYVKSVNLVLVC